MRLCIKGWQPSESWYVLPDKYCGKVRVFLAGEELHGAVMAVDDVAGEVVAWGVDGYELRYGPVVVHCPLELRVAATIWEQQR